MKTPVRPAPRTPKHRRELPDALLREISQATDPADWLTCRGCGFYVALSDLEPSGMADWSCPRCRTCL